MSNADKLSIECKYGLALVQKGKAPKYLTGFGPVFIWAEKLYNPVTFKDMSDTLFSGLSEERINSLLKNMDIPKGAEVKVVKYQMSAKIHQDIRVDKPVVYHLVGRPQD